MREIIPFSRSADTVISKESRMTSEKVESKIKEEKYYEREELRNLQPICVNDEK